MPNFALRWTLPILALSLLTACATGNSNPACVCPPIKEYSREFQKKLADEIVTMNENNAVISAMQDYLLIRRQLVVCQ